MMLPRSLFTTMTVAVAALIVAGCGGSSDGRPTADELSDSLQHGKASSLVPADASLSEDGADCLGKALHDSKLSDEALRAFVDGDKDYKGSDDDTKALSDLSDKASACTKQ
jgi:hypothetical protein